MNTSSTARREYDVVGCHIGIKISNIVIIIIYNKISNTIVVYYYQINTRLTKTSNETIHDSESFRLIDFPLHLQYLDFSIWNEIL